MKERAPRERDVTSLLIVVFCLVKKSVAVKCEVVVFGDASLKVEFFSELVRALG